MSDDLKRAAARAAVAQLPERGVIGLGSGSTVRFFVEEVGRLVKAGRALVGVPTSEGTRAQAAALGIPMLDDDGPWEIDVTVDGADEVDADKQLIKGGGAAHAREKIVSAASKRNVIIVDESKLSRRLGEKWPVPVEVCAFGHRATAAKLAKLGDPVLRTHSDRAIKTDAGNPIYDLRTGPIADPGALERAIGGVVGVVAVGLFVGRADVIVVARANGTIDVLR